MRFSRERPPRLLWRTLSADDNMLSSARRASINGRSREKSATSHAADFFVDKAEDDGKQAFAEDDNAVGR